jgi:signal transduction histidine kinase
MIIVCYHEHEHSHRTVNGPINVTLNYSLKLLFFSNIQYKNRTPFVIVFIKDNDIGIDKESISRFFTKFASRSFQGIGLGLYLSKIMVKAHGRISEVATICMVRAPHLVLVYL